VLNTVGGREGIGYKGREKIPLAGTFWFPHFLTVNEINPGCSCLATAKEANFYQFIRIKCVSLFPSRLYLIFMKDFEQKNPVLLKNHAGTISIF